LPAGNDASAFFQSDYYGADYSSTTDTDPSLHDFSMGVNGAVITAPEPSSLALLALVLVGLVGRMVWVMAGISREQ